MTDLDPPNVRRRLGEEASDISHARVAYGHSRGGVRFVFVTVVVLLSALAGWSAADLLVAAPGGAPLVAGAGIVGGALVGVVLAFAALSSARLLGLR